MDDNSLQEDHQQEENQTTPINEDILSVPIQDQGMSTWDGHNTNQQKPFRLNLPRTAGHPGLRWLILDCQKIAQIGQVYDCKRIASAVQYLWDNGHRDLILCIPEKMKLNENLEYRNIHFITDLHAIIPNFLVYTPSESREASFMEILAKHHDALIVSQTGPNTWSEPFERFLPFVFINNSFKLPKDPWGRKGLSLSDLLRSKNGTNKPFEVTVVYHAIEQWGSYSKIIKEITFDFSLSDEPGKDLPLLIIDGSNVAMSHGLNVFYSCFGIYLAVKHFWNQRYYRNIIVCVPNMRKNSRYTVYGYEWLDMLYERGLVSLTPTLSYDDWFMLEETRDTNGFIVTNDKFVDFDKKTWDDTKQRCIRYEFKGNDFNPISCEAIGRSSVQPTDLAQQTI